MGWGKFRKSVSKSIRKVTGSGIGGLVLAGKGGVMDKALRETGHAVGYLTGANAMADLADAQAAAAAQQAAAAERATQIAAGNQQINMQAGQEEALKKIMRKSALQASIRTAGQPRGNTTLG